MGNPALAMRAPPAPAYEARTPLKIALIGVLSFLIFGLGIWNWTVPLPGIEQGNVGYEITQLIWHNTVGNA
jgi:hypothetical protein